MFHISQLKHSPSAGQQVIPTLPALGEEGQILAKPEVLDRRSVDRGGVMTSEVLVKWMNLPTESASWEDCQALKQQFPHFNS